MSAPESLDEWVALAEEDLLNIQNNLAATRTPWRTVCFHAQQSAEKYLKAVLIHEGVRPPLRHDLVELLALVAEKQPDLGDVEDECFDLNPYAVAVRYPGAPMSVTESEGRAAVTSADRIRAAARHVLGLPN